MSVSKEERLKALYAERVAPIARQRPEWDALFACHQTELDALKARQRLELDALYDRQIPERDALRARIRAVQIEP